jgi:hypothetical protein
MMPAAIPVIGGFLDTVINLISKNVQDKDLAAKLTAETTKEMLGFATVLIQQQTLPWVDATVKLAYAMRDVGISLVRPVGSVLMACFAAYMMYKQVPIPSWAEPVLVAFGVAPGAWGLSRHIEKTKK